jgi:quinate dehydrogenase
MTTAVQQVEMDASQPATQPDRHGYLFGLKIQASMSPLFHRTIYNELGLRWEQRLFESDNIPRFLELIRDPKFYGAWARRLPNLPPGDPFL